MDVVEYTQKKWTRDQKRAMGSGISDTLDMHSDQRVNLLQERSPAVLRGVQSTLAVIAVEEADDPEAWLRDVLDALDIRRVIPVRVVADVCGSHRGTLRGYNTHLRRYTRLCAPCEAFRKEALAAKTALKGVPEGANVKWPM